MSPFWKKQNAVILKHPTSPLLVLKYPTIHMLFFLYHTIGTVDPFFFFINQRVLVFFIIVLLAFIKKPGSIFSEGGGTSHRAPCMDMWWSFSSRPMTVVEDGDWWGVHRKTGRGLPGERYSFGGDVSGGGGGARDIESWRRIGKDGERRKKTFKTFWRRGVFIVVERLLDGVRLLGFFYD